MALTSTDGRQAGQGGESTALQTDYLLSTTTGSQCPPGFALLWISLRHSCLCPRRATSRASSVRHLTCACCHLLRDLPSIPYMLFSYCYRTDALRISATPARVSAISTYSHRLSGFHTTPASRVLPLHLPIAATVCWAFTCLSTFTAICRRRCSAGCLFLPARTLWRDSQHSVATCHKQNVAREPCGVFAGRDYAAAGRHGRGEQTATCAHRPASPARNEGLCVPRRRTGRPHSASPPPQPCLPADRRTPPAAGCHTTCPHICHRAWGACLP